MASPANFRCSKPTFHLLTNLQRSPPQRLSFPLFTTKSSPVKLPVIRASSSSSPPSNPKPSLLKTTCITLTAAAALFSASCYLSNRPHAISTPLAISLEEAMLEKRLETDSNDVEALLSLAEIKFNSKKRDEAISILNRMIEIDPDQQEWLLMKARMLSCNGESELAIEAFEEILSKDPDRVEAYHYLVMEYCLNVSKLTELEKRINNTMERYKKKNKKKMTKEIRDLTLLIAQIRIIEGNLEEAIRICDVLAKDDPKDFRMYMLKGYMYFLMDKKDEAAKAFEKCGTMFTENSPLRELENASEWRMIEAYESVLLYSLTFAKLMVTSLIKKFV